MPILEINKAITVVWKGRVNSAISVPELLVTKVAITFIVVVSVVSGVVVVIIFVVVIVTVVVVVVIEVGPEKGIHII